MIAEKVASGLPAAIVIAIGLAFAAAPAPAVVAAGDCASLTDIRMANVSVVSAALVTEGAFTPPTPRGASALRVPAFCRVVVVATPTADSHINIEIWIPDAGGWNGRFQG